MGPATAQLGNPHDWTCVYAALMKQRFLIAAARLGFNKHRHGLDITQFSVPPSAGD